MNDVTDVVRAMAAVEPAESTRARGIQIAQALSSQLGGSVRWDEGAGEDWAQVVVGTSTRAFVGIRWPMVIVLRRDGDSVEPLIARDVARVVVSDMDEPELCASEESLLATFGERARSAALTRDGFSAADLWFATV